MRKEKNVEQCPDITPTKLAEQNYGLVYYVAHRFQNCDIEFDELVSICSLGLVKAANSFDQQKARFATYAVTVMTNEVLCELRKMRREQRYRAVSLDETLEDGCMVLDFVPDKKDCFVYVHMQDTIMSCVNALTDTEREIVYLLIVDEKTQGQVGDRLGISQSYVSRIYKNATRKMRRIAQK